MSVSGVSGSSGYQSPEMQAVERDTLVLKKHQDVQKAQAEALVQLVQNATPQDGVGTLVNAYA
jgi:hypothetical protein